MRWGYDPDTWTLVDFHSGCAAFAAPVEPEEDGGPIRFQSGLGYDRPSARAAAVSRSELISGRRSHVVDSLCVGDLIE